MLKPLLLGALALLMLAGPAMAGSDGLSNMWAMRGRMNAQLHHMPAPMIPQFNSMPSDR
ncbi:hypothetical protein [Chromobacterium paludis]|uniref:hypothetical protein n=1 Tax=Chromobacterium paludis TaxID=2605945 RepID=UPI00143D68A2|nr:hypothetical protein [Chromobacterium paludis]